MLIGMMQVTMQFTQYMLIGNLPINMHGVMLGVCVGPVSHMHDNHLIRTRSLIKNYRYSHTDRPDYPVIACYLHMIAHIHMHAYMNVCIHVGMVVCGVVRVHACMYAVLHVCMYAVLYVCLYACMHVLHA